MRVLVMVVTAVLFGCAAAAGGYFLGEYAPGDGIAALGVPYSEIRNAEAEHYAFLGGAVGAFLGMLLGGVVRLSSADDRRNGKFHSEEPSVATKTVSPPNPASRQWAGAGTLVVGLALCCSVKRDVDVPLIASAALMWIGWALVLPYNDWLFRIVTGAMASFISTVVVVALFGVFGAPHPTLAASRPPTVAPTIAVAVRPMEVTYDTMFRAFMDNEAAATEKYGHARVRFEASFRSVTRAPDGALIAQVDDGNEFTESKLSLRPAAEHDGAALPANEPATFICSATKKSATRLRMDDCSVDTAAVTTQRATGVWIRALFKNGERHAGEEYVLSGFYKDAGLCDRPCDDEEARYVVLHDRGNRHLPHEPAFITLRVRIRDDGGALVLGRLEKP